jgi:hypothetical protein
MDEAMSQRCDVVSHLFGALEDLWMEISRLESEKRWEKKGGAKTSGLHLSPRI